MTSNTAPDLLPGSESAFVLEGRPLRPSTQLADTARFDDDLWPLAPASLQGQQRALALRFDTVPDSYRHVLKQLCHGQLSGPLPAHEARPKISSVVTHFYSLRVFFRWLDGAVPGCDVGQVDAEVLRRYQRYLLTRYRSPARRHALRAAVVMLWRYRTCLDCGGLRIDPRTLAEWRGPYQSRTENTTDRIPEEVHTRLLIWALRFVDEFSPDIIEAVDRWNGLREAKTERKGNRVPWGTRIPQIHTYLRDAVENRRPLPGINGHVNINALARAIGCDPSSVNGCKDAIEDAVALVGVSDYACLDVSIKGTIEGSPWLEGIRLDAAMDDSLTVLTQMLQAACYIVVAFLSGMRDSEVKHLRTGCVSVQRGSTGVAYRWRVSSIAFKGETEDEGAPATWIVGEEAARAIAVLERIHQTRGGGRTDWLFAPIKCGPGIGSAGRGGNPAMTTAGSNRQINRFVTWVNVYCATRGRSDTIPDIDGQPFRLSTRQFRRTLAWFIARKPGGSIAGAIAYRHRSIQMFEGYAGTSDSGFRAEVEAEQALAQAEHLLALIDRHDHTFLGGPAAEEAERRIAALAENPSFQGTITTDRRRLTRLMAREGPAIYPGTYATCVYDHTKALCRTKTGVYGNEPDATECKPLKCGNVALDEDNLDRWRAELKLVDADVADRPTLPPLLASRLSERREEISAFLASETARNPQ